MSNVSDSDTLSASSQLGLRDHGLGGRIRSGRRAAGKAEQPEDGLK